MCCDCAKCQSVSSRQPCWHCQIIIIIILILHLIVSITNVLVLIVVAVLFSLSWLFTRKITLQSLDCSDFSSTVKRKSNIWHCNTTSKNMKPLLLRIWQSHRVAWENCQHCVDINLTVVRTSKCILCGNLYVCVSVLALDLEGVHDVNCIIPHPPWPLLISDVGLELEGTLINCSLL